MTTQEMTTQEMTVQEVIDAYYATSARGDWEGWLALFGNPFAMHDIMGGVITDLPTLAEHVEVIKTGYSRFLMTPVRVLISGEEAFVQWHCLAANRAGAPIDAKGVNYFQVRNGKIAYLEEFFDLRPFEPFLNQP